MKPHCYNCKHAGVAFKIGKLTHQHCQSPQAKADWDAGKINSAWDTLRVFSDKCKDHEFKVKINLEVKEN
jgi:hypothetical protein